MQLQSLRLPAIPSRRSCLYHRPYCLCSYQSLIVLKNKEDKYITIDEGETQILVVSLL